MRTAEQLHQAYVEHQASRPDEGWQDADGHRIEFIYEHGGDPDDIACHECGKKLTLKTAILQAGLPSDDAEQRRVGVPAPVRAFCVKHRPEF